jgi:hypothetical protein
VARRARLGSTSVACGLLCGTAANLLWSLTFLVPVVLSTSGSLVITLGRYVF